jgi:hypothetical protein
MTEKISYRSLKEKEIKALESQGCTAETFGDIQVAEGFNPAWVRNSHFIGKVKIGDLSGKIKNASGLEKTCGIYNATIANCTIGNSCRVANVGVHIANYDIAEGVCIENVGTMQTNPGATFGNGVEVEVLNEAGGREVVLFNELNAQFAYMLCMHRYRPKMVEKLKAIAKEYADSVKADCGKVAVGARISSVAEIIDVNIGSYATVNNAAALNNGTILSELDAPTKVGAEVIAHDFIIAEGSSVTGGAILCKVFVGQGCQIGKQYSAENSLFFANCEAFHGEACSVFAGPYSVTHHKSSLLIAGLFSFYNAGSGTNQSNHMYKLGPAHEGKLLRGSKTGSFSYMMWPCNVGPFSVVLGKHVSTFDTADFPFSHLDARSDGKCNMVPGLHLTTVGTVRDGAKWSSRDRRKGSVKRDIICFDVFSPYTIGKMLKAFEKLKHLEETTYKGVEEVSVGGAIVRRLILRTGQKYYRTGIEMYLLEKVIEKAEQGLDSARGKINSVFATISDAVYSSDWVDIGGQMMPEKRLIGLEDAIESGRISNVEVLMSKLQKIFKAYKNDEWVWVKNKYKEVFGVDLDTVSKDGIKEAAQNFLKVKSKFLTLVAADAEKEFDEKSRCGFGQDGKGDAVQKDFQQVRGTYEDNSFVKEIKDDIQKLQKRIAAFEQKLSSM